MLEYFLNKVAVLNKTPTQVFSCETCEIFKNTFFAEHLRMTASESSKYVSKQKHFWMSQTQNMNFHVEYENPIATTFTGDIHNGNNDNIN